MDYLFQLRFRVAPYRWRDRVTLTAFERPTNSHRTGYTLEVKVGGKVLFPRDNGPLWGEFSPLHSIDGPEAREHCLNHLALRPGDTDADFFESYTADQLAFVEAHSDDITIVKFDRYQDY